MQSRFIVTLTGLAGTLAGCAGAPLHNASAVTPVAPSATPAAAPNRGPADASAFAIARLTPALRSQIEIEFLVESNRLRATGGVNPLVRDPRLDAAATKYAEHLARRRVLEHDSDVPELRTPEMRAAAEGANERFVGETLALLASTPESTASRTVRLWSESPDHRRVMMKKIYHRVGIGIAQDAERVWYVVQMYAPGRI